MPSVLKFKGTATTGSIAIGDANQTLTIGAGGSLTLTAAESITNGKIVMSGGALADAFGLTIGTGATLSGYGTVSAATEGAGKIVATGGTLEFTAAVDSTTASDIRIGDGAVLKFDSTVGSSSVAPTITFQDGANTLDLSATSLSAFHATIAGFAAGDAIKMAGADSFVLDSSGMSVAIHDSAHGALGTLQFASASLGQWLTVDAGALKAAAASSGGSDSIIGTAGANSYDGGGGADVIYGMAGNDVLKGGAGADVLYGGDGYDELRGGEGADFMYGGSGSDTIYVDDAGDQVFEAVGEGNETVWTTVSWALTPGQQIETVSVVFGALPSGAVLTGNEFNNRLVGGFGNDVLNGGAGNDMLSGGPGGADQFVFSDALGATNVDTILNFDGSDTLVLDHTVFGGLAPGDLTAAQFALGSATGSAAQIVYDQATGALFYDTNGASEGGATQFAVMNGAPTTLGYSHFDII